MKTNFNLESAICTSREQSERLLALGLKKETADMCWTKMAAIRGTFYVPELAPINMVSWRHTPAWSLHRLLCLYNVHYLEFMGDTEIASAYDIVIDAIEMAINGGYFSEKYLV